MNKFIEKLWAIQYEDSRNLIKIFHHHQSTFSTTLVRPSGDGYIALSNMPEASSVADSPSAGMTEVTFEKSVPMVSYLAIFVVCDFEYLESNTPEKNIPFRSVEVYYRYAGLNSGNATGFGR